MKKRCNWSTISSVVDSVLNSYSDKVKNGIKESTLEVAQEGKEQLRRNSPRRTGDYYKGWRIRTKEGATYIHCTLYNASKYRLTHLLEKGHKSRNGGRTRAIPHIEPVEQYVQEEYKKKIENIIGGK